jgi:hypothetical protein
MEGAGEGREGEDSLVPCNRRDGMPSPARFGSGEGDEGLCNGSERDGCAVDCARQCKTQT